MAERDSAVMRRATPITDPNGSKRLEAVVRTTGLGYQPGTGDFFDRPWGLQSGGPYSSIGLNHQTNSPQEYGNG